MKSIRSTIEMNKKKNKVLIIIVDRMINIDDSKVNEQSPLKQKWSSRSIPMTSIYFYQSTLFHPLLFSLSFFQFDLPSTVESLLSSFILPSISRPLSFHSLSSLFLFIVKLIKICTWTITHRNDDRVFVIFLLYFYNQCFSTSLSRNVFKNLYWSH